MCARITESSQQYSALH